MTNEVSDPNIPQTTMSRECGNTNVKKILFENYEIHIKECKNMFSL